MFDASQRGRGSLLGRFRQRRPEIEEAIFVRLLDVPDPADESTRDRARATRGAIGAALEFAVAGVVDDGATAPSPPTLLLERVRGAARHGVRRDTILRRYVAGQAAFADFLVEEAEAAGLSGDELQAMLATQATLGEHLLGTIGREYDRARRGGPALAAERLELVERMLAGEGADTSGIPYDFGANHVGVIALGPGAHEAIRALAAQLDRLLFSVADGEGAIWAWLGGRRSLDAREVERGTSVAPRLSIAFGEPARGLAGWRLTHRQARAAMAVTSRSSTVPTHYADVALLATIAGDDLLANSLRQLYLVPLQRERDGGARARATLRAYFAAERNVSSTAAILGVSRRTVANRLHVIEAHLGCCLSTCTFEMEAALRLDDFEGSGRGASRAA